MKRAAKVLAALIVVVLLVGAGGVAWFLRAPSGYEARLAAVDRQARAGPEAGRWAGVMWAVVAPGEVLASGAAGFADIEAGTPMTPDAIMPIGSISKVLIGIAGAQAILNGDLDPGAPISDILTIPFDPPDGAPRSFAQLATHTGSLNDIDPVYEAAGYHYDGPDHPVDLDDFLASALGAEGALYDPGSFAQAPPGTRYAYSNIGAGLAAQVVADATGRDFAETTMADIVAPLSLAGFWGQTRPPGPKNVTLYERTEDGDFRALAPYGLATWPDGQFNASAHDLARLMAVMMNDGRFEGEQLLPEAVVDLVTTPQVEGLPDLVGEDDFVGLFWTRETLELGPIVMQYEGHSGGDPGLSTFMYRSPDHPTGFVLMFTSDERGLVDVLAMVRLARTLGGMPLPE